MVRGLGAEITDGPGDFPYDDDGMGYDALSFRRPDGLELDAVHLPGLAGAYQAKGDPV